MIPLRFVCRLLLILVVLSLQACATAQTYSAKPITATVVDAETDEPLEGVNVVAHWVLHDRMTWGGVGDLELFEAVTDRAGRFQFPGWADKVPPGTWPHETRLSNQDPELLLFKSGYKPTAVGNYLQPQRLRSEDHTWERYSDWDGKTIKLEKFKGDLRLYSALAEGLKTGLGSGIKCPWKKTPRLYASLIMERGRLDRLGVRNYLPTLQLMELSFKNSGCGSAQEFFEE